MKRAFYLFSAAIIGAAAVLSAAGWWHELVQADKQATQYMRANHPGVAAAAKRMGDGVRSASGPNVVLARPAQ